MLYVRLSLMTPKPDEAAVVAGIIDDLLAVYAAQPGYITGYSLRSPESEQLGRVTVWRDAEAADAAAQVQHVLAQRAELTPLVEADSHLEWSFEAAAADESLVALVGR
ncbi:MAG: hypothetical protein IVW36_10240 [Dehalococcoidia bacterium]|nr:hypothetical protein [Dehalococcoidia bacterium]